MLPKLELTVCNQEKRNDGVVLLTIGRNTRSIRKKSDFEAIIAIDRGGEIIWFREFDFCLMDCRYSLQNTLLVMGTDGRAAEINLDGTLRNLWYCRERFPDGLDGIPLETMKLHHALTELPDGNIASLSIQHHNLENYEDGWSHFMADTIVIFSRAGKIVDEFSLTDVLDTGRFGYGAFSPYWAIQGWPKTKDWTHANSVIRDPKDGSFLVSLRHQDAVVKVTQDRELVWILGDSAGWTGKWRERLLHIDGGRPFYHQHDLSFTEAGDLMLYDNGTSGAFPPNLEQPIEERESFALAYRIEENLMKATEVWRYGGQNIPYSHYVSGVCELPNGNRFIANTGLRHDLEGNRVELPPQGVGTIELLEVTTDGEIVFQATLADSLAKPEEGWNGFRPEYLDPKVSLQLKL